MMLNIKRITTLFLLLLSLALTACDLSFDLPFFSKNDQVDTPAADGGELSLDQSDKIVIPPIYVTVALHLEDVPVYNNCQAFPGYREKLLVFAEAIAPYNPAVNLQSEYEFLLGVTRCETPEMRNLTGDMNVLDYLVEQYGYEIDAHQQGGWNRDGRDNYADIRWLAGELTAGVSETMGGLVYDDPLQWKHLAEGQKGKQAKNYIWEPQALTLAVSSRHRSGDFTADDFYSGVWIPAGTGSDFWSHDPQGPFVYVGPGEHDNWNNKFGKRSTPEFIRDLILLLESGALEPDLIYTATIAVPQSIIFSTAEHQKLLVLLEQLVPLAEEGKIVYANYAEIIQIWQQQYGARPNLYIEEDVDVKDQDQDQVAADQLADLPPLQTGENSLIIINPTSGASLSVTVFMPESWDRSSSLPALVLVPGGTGNSRDFTQNNPSGVSMVSAINDACLIAVIFDPDGRGLSTGIEDHGGYNQQDGLAALVHQIASLPAVNSRKVGIVTLSYGITMGSGALARYPDLPVQFLIDWEGPANRDDTGGCDEDNIGHLSAIAACDDHNFWSEREAANFIGKISVPYQRIQGAKDHVQPDQAHTVLMINNAVKGSCPWVRLNDEQSNQIYSLETIPLKPSVNSRKPIEALVVRYALELFEHKD